MNKPTLKKRIKERLSQYERAVKNCTIDSLMCRHLKEDYELFKEIVAENKKLKRDNAKLRKTWLDVESIPKDGNPFVAKIKGYPWPVFAVYNACDNNICYTIVEAEDHEDGCDMYFTNQWDEIDEIECWHALSALPEDTTTPQ